MSQHKNGSEPDLSGLDGLNIDDKTRKAIGAAVQTAISTGVAEGVGKAVAAAENAKVVTDEMVSDPSLPYEKYVELRERQNEQRRKRSPNA